MNSYATWFGRVVLLGVAINLALSLPTLFVPERMLALLHLPMAEPTLWVQFSANLLILLSLFYIPAAIDPMRYQTSAWLAVFARVAGTVFFLTQPRDYVLFGLFDMTFAAIEGLLLVLALRQVGGNPLQEKGV